MPSRKVVIPLILTTLLGGGWWFFANQQKQLPAENQITAINNNAGGAHSKDSDSDGLKDWEEFLWKTDAHNPDTDGDGTTDNEEILAKRDPRKPGPNDEIEKQQLEKPETREEKTAGEEQNITAAVAENFMKSYITRKLASSNDPSLLNTEALAAETLMNMQAALTKSASEKMMDNFSEHDIRVGTDNTQKAIRAYINAVGALVLAQNQKESKGVYVTAMEALNNNDTAGFESLREKAILFAVLSEKLRTEIVSPPSLVEAHLQFINSFAHFGEITNKIADFEADPLGGMAALVQYKQESVRSLEALAAITDAINEYNLTFSNSEGGAVFAQYTSYKNTGS